MMKKEMLYAYVGMIFGFVVGLMAGMAFVITHPVHP